jgi:ER membrane protein complex subunit 2
MYTSNKESFGNDVYQAIDAMFIAAIESKRFHIAAKCEALLHKAFGVDPKILRNNYTMLNASGLRAKSFRLYTDIIKDNLADVESKKRRISLVRGQDNIKEYVNDLNNF